MYRIGISRYQAGKQDLEAGVSTINSMYWASEVLPYYSLIWKKKDT